ncbi:MAG: NAD/NADP octopine/nopaline dehydrogenase family protein [Clostridia bacterium]|nr:NAD/NADP octopine/nopaline dehydrogenase family protein [Clostridia bacterium]
MKITVIGCGNGAFATAADLSARGHEITLFVQESHKHNFDAIREKKTIKAMGVGPVGEIPIHEITNDIEVAMKEYDLIIPVLPSFAHEEIAKIIAPFIKSGDKIFLSPGSTGGALVFAKVFRDLGKLDGVKIAEVHTLPYTARRVGQDGVNISLITDVMYFAAFPAKYNQEMYDLIYPLYPNLKMMTDVLETGLNNGNGTTHPAPVVLNAGKIEYYKKHYHYKEGITPSVGNVIQLIDDERKNICAAFGYEQIDIKDRLFNMGYCPKKDTVYECIQGSTDIFLPLEGPNDLNGRYLVEDAPYTLVCMSSVASAVGVKTPLMQAVVNLAGALKNEDYWHVGRTLEKVGLNNMSVEQIKKYLQEGVIG